MKEDEEFWDAVDEKVSSQSDERAAVLSANGDDSNSLERKLTSLKVSTDTTGCCCFPPSFNKNILSNSINSCAQC